MSICSEEMEKMKNCTCKITGNKRYAPYIIADEVCEKDYSRIIVNEMAA